jgi:hypothetical protein
MPAAAFAMIGKANSALRHASMLDDGKGQLCMSGRFLEALIATTLAAAHAAALQASPVVGGTVAITTPSAREGEPSAAISSDAAAKAFGLRSFTILNDPAHAAYVAEVITTRTAVGTAVAQGRAGQALATGGGVSIPISKGKSILVPLQRTRVEIRLRRRGETEVLWHGAAVTVRSAAAPDGSADQVAFALSQAALSSYPTQTVGEISVP